MSTSEKKSSLSVAVSLVLIAQSAQFIAVSYGDSALDKLLADQVVDLAVVFHESTPLDNPDATKAELEQFISFRRGGE